MYATLGTRTNRDGRIRTGDPLNPIQVRYRTAPRPERTRNITSLPERTKKTGHGGCCLLRAQGLPPVSARLDFSGLPHTSEVKRDRRWKQFRSDRHRQRPRRLCRRHPRGPARTERRLRGIRGAGRGLPEHRLHPHQGPPVQRAAGHPAQEGETARHSSGRNAGRSGPGAEAQPQRRRTSDARHRPSLQEEQGDPHQGLWTPGRGRHRRGAGRRRRFEALPRAQRHPRHRLPATRHPRADHRWRARLVVHARSLPDGSPGAPGDRGRRRGGHRVRRHLRCLRLEGHGGGDARPHSAGGGRGSLGGGREELQAARAWRSSPARA